MKFYVIQQLKDGKYLQAENMAMTMEIFAKSFNTAYVFDAITAPVKGMLRKGERAVEVEQVWRVKK